MPPEKLKEAASRAFMQAVKFIGGGNWRQKYYAYQYVDTA